MNRDDAARVLALVRDSPLFQSLRPRRLRQVVSGSRLEQYAPHSVILRQGSPGDAFYVVVQGQVAVRTHFPQGESSPLATLGPGQCFGEMALLSARPRAADVVAVSGCEVLVVPRAVFEGQLLGDAGFKARLVAQSHERERELVRERLARSLQNTPLFGGLRWEELVRVAAEARTADVAPGAVVCRQGAESTALYVLLSGELELRVAAGDAERRVATLTAGASFGERALLDGEPLPATLVANRSSTLAMLDRGQLLALVTHGPQARGMVGLLGDSRRADGGAHTDAGTPSTMIVVVEHEPGVGGPRLAVNLALSLAAQSVSVVLIDLSPDAAAARYAGASGALSGDAPGAVTEAAGGLAVVAVPDAAGASAATRLGRALPPLRARYGFVVVNVPAGDAQHLGGSLAPDVSLLTTRGTGQLPAGRLAPETLVVYTPEAVGALEGADAGNQEFRLPTSPSARERFRAEDRPFVLAEPRSFLSRAVGRIARYLTRQQVGLVLWGGSAAAPIQAGVLAGLEERDVDVDLIAATGVGSMLAAAYASGLPVQALEHLGAAFQSPLDDLLAPRTLRHADASRGRRLRHVLRSLFDGARLEGLQVPLWLGAVDPDTGEEVVFGTGPLVEALEASLGLHGYGPGTRRAGRPLLDASVLNPLPLRFAREMGADVVVAVAPEAPVALGLPGRARVGRRRAPLHLALLTLRLAAQRLAAASVEAADVVIAPRAAARGAARGHAMFQQGRGAAVEAAPRIAALQAARLRPAVAR